MKLILHSTMQCILFCSLIFCTMTTAHAYNKNAPRWINPDSNHYYDEDYSYFGDSDYQRAYEEGYRHGYKDGYKDRKKEVRKKRRKNKRPYRNVTGWNVPPSIAKNHPNCHRYTLRVAGGRSSARLMSITQGENIIKSDGGTHNGFVCFTRPTQLELGKFNSSNPRVFLQIKDVGTFVFNRGDRGQKKRNGWLRAFWNL